MFDEESSIVSILADTIFSSLTLKDWELKDPYSENERAKGFKKYFTTFFHVIFHKLYNTR